MGPGRLSSTLREPINTLQATTQPRHLVAAEAQWRQAPSQCSSERKTTTEMNSRQVAFTDTPVNTQDTPLIVSLKGHFVDISSLLLNKQAVLRRKIRFPARMVAGSATCKQNSKELCYAFSLYGYENREFVYLASLSCD